MTARRSGIAIYARFGKNADIDGASIENAVKQAQLHSVANVLGSALGIRANYKGRKRTTIPRRSAPAAIHYNPLRIAKNEVKKNSSLC